MKGLGKRNGSKGGGTEYCHFKGEYERWPNRDGESENRARTCVQHAPDLQGMPQDEFLG